MSTPGIANPYWYEWYVGLEQVIKMINPDSKITYVIFQSGVHNTIDDVVVGYENKQEMCFQVKHEIGNVGKGNLTFSKLIEPTTRESGTEKVSLIKAIAIGWEEAKLLEANEIIPILYTNRNLGVNSTNRFFCGNEYKALSLTKFVEKLKEVLKKTACIQDIEKHIDEQDFKMQWLEFKNAINDNDTKVIEFLKALKIEYNQGSLDDLENKMIKSLEEIFKCNQIVAQNLFDKLCAKLKIWTTTRRMDKEKVTVEDVFDALSINNDIEHGEHKLPYPSPFFLSREVFSEELIRLIKKTNKKIIFISGEPGSGKTSLISYLQLKHNLFRARYHTFKPISPEQKFYNADPGLSRPESLWYDLLIQLRGYFKGQLNKYAIPVTNALCSVEQMRNEVIKLAKLLYENTGEKTVICIDGIDHAARVQNDVTFLSTLFNPSEIPEGVIFTIVGQPALMYDKYPVWIRRQSEYVEHVPMPKLLREDIISLITETEIELKIDVDVLAEFIFEKTEGNNLSVVFAIEEAKVCKDIDEFEKCIDKKHVSGDITNYYSHIWGYASAYLNTKSLGFPFPETVVASAITLLGGRVNSKILNKALEINLKKEEWEELLDLLYPLIQKVSNNENEYALFHNDFRVFLMAEINQSSSIFKRVASQLADYYISNHNTVESLVNLMPLLISADKKDIIAEAFNVEYVMHALSYGISRNKLREYAEIAYESALNSKEWKTYHNVYLAINTLHQHFRYYEFFDKKYTLQDKSYVKKIHPYELNSSPLKIEYLYSYKEMLDFCEDLLTYKDSISKRRACSTYNLWMKDLTPPKFVNELNVNELLSQGLWDENLKVEIINKWATLASKLDIGNIVDVDSLQCEEEIKASVQFNNTYFEYLLENNKIDESINVIKNGGVSFSCIEDNIKKILFRDSATEFKEILKKIIEKRPNLNDQLLARICLITSIKELETINLEELEPISYITDQTSLKMICFSIIKGFQDYDKDVSISIDQINELLSTGERKGPNYEYLKVLISHGFILGRSIKKLDEKLDDSDKELLLSSYRDFMLYDTRKVRTFDFKEGFNLLLFLSLKREWVPQFIDQENLNQYVIEHLFNRNRLGMHYKTILLDYIVNKEMNNILEKYILELYGPNGTNLFQGSNFEDTHKCFEKYGNNVLPELMNEVNNKLNWDVVGYVDHKEYALWPLLQYFKKIMFFDKQDWKNRGISLNKLSYIANIKGSNRSSFEINKEIASAAIRSGFSDAWLLRNENQEFRFSLEILYNQIFDLLDNVKNLDEIITVWYLSCGILSWYNSDDRKGLGNVYHKCLEKGSELGIQEIEQLIHQLTPEHAVIANYGDTPSFQEHQSENGKKREEADKELRQRMNSFSIHEIVEFLNNEQDKLLNIKSVDIAFGIIEERGGLTQQIALNFLEILKRRLENYSWENMGFENILEKIIKVLTTDFLWSLAEYNKLNLDEGDHYYTCTSNMNFLLQLVVSKSENDLVKHFFDKELECQNNWITGCGNLIKEHSYYQPSVSNLTPPNNLQQFVFNVLIEQVETKNIHRIEIGLQGIHLLIKRYPELFLHVASSWVEYNHEQKEYLIKLSERWSQENIQGFVNLKSIIENEYYNANELDKIIQLYLILSNYEFVTEGNDNLKFLLSAPSIEYDLPERCPQKFDSSQVSNATNCFLSVMETCTGESYENIKYYISSKKNVIEASRKVGESFRQGDSMLLSRTHTQIDSQILYGEEQKGRWEVVPLTIKAQSLLLNDDSWLISQPPKFSFSDEWDIEYQLEETAKNKTLYECKPYLKKIVSKDIPENMEVIGSCIWYPIGSKDGVIYTEVAKLSEIGTKTNYNITHAMNPGSILSRLEELFTIDDESLNDTGLCLTKQLVGSSVFFYGNSMIYPSMDLREIFNIEPLATNPLIWVKKETKEVVLYFERESFPNRKATHEQYFRQPLISRWLCNKDLLDQEVKKLGLVLYKVDAIEKMPNFGV
ncbi:ATP-binding protein [Neobacillus bataviensis]|uniref:ATP-binding protein n=1 Tax=Neobacillus bataviensis TaxID=220685 RepID=UPI001CC14C8D|nr:ATP-binding protein [Neobacillus bataviensis]